MIVKKFLKSIVFLCLFIISSTNAQSSINPIQLPQLTHYVSDFSNVLAIDQLDEFEILAKTYDTKTSNQLVTVIFPHRQGNELIDIAMKIFKDTTIGQTKTNNGLLLVIATDEKKIRILVGYGLESVYPDLIAQQVIDEIRPFINNADFYGAVKLFYERSIQIIGGEMPQGYTLQSHQNSTIIKAGVVTLVPLGLLLGVFFLHLYFYTLWHKDKKKSTRVKGMYDVLYFILSIFLLQLSLSFKKYYHKNKKKYVQQFSFPLILKLLLCIALLIVGIALLFSVFPLLAYGIGFLFFGVFFGAVFSLVILLSPDTISGRSKHSGGNSGGFRGDFWSDSGSNGGGDGGGSDGGGFDGGGGDSGGGGAGD